MKLSTEIKADSASLESCSDTPRVGMSPGEVVVPAVPYEAGAGAPTVGTSPAKAEDERTHARATSNENRFTDFSPLKSRMQDFLHGKEYEQLREVLARGD